MNYDNLHELINRYEEKIDTLYGSEHYELFKWEAVKTWRDAWFAPRDAFASFGDRYAAARKGLGWFMDNSRMHPSSGVIKLWEAEPLTVEWLFNQVLFAETREYKTLQTNIFTFKDEYERLRLRHFPSNWSFKQDLHSISIYLAMNDPDFNYVFKSNEAHTMAKYTDFGLDIGYGGSFNLENYYRLCDEIVQTLREHQSLLDKHFSKLTEKCYRDESLHLLAFDLMYCSRTYGFYKGLIAPVTGETVKKALFSTTGQAPETDIEKVSRISDLEQELDYLENKIAKFDEIPLVGVQVGSDKYGPGEIVEQTFNKIKVKFKEIEKTFILDEKYSARPRFEDDDAVVAAFTEHRVMQERMKKIQKELDQLSL